MEKIFADTVVGRKNIGFSIALFLILGVAVGIPLTIDLFGGSMLTVAQYQIWKVVHAYGVFLAFINFFVGLSLDRLSLTRQQKEITSWSFLLAGFFGGIGRMTLVLLSALSAWGLLISLAETVLFVVGTAALAIGLLKNRTDRSLEPALNIQASQLK